MTRPKLTPEQWVRVRFPNTEARKAADDAAMALPDEDTMQKHMQVWVDTYEEMSR